jgi:hypothetical protein
MFVGEGESQRCLLDLPIQVQHALLQDTACSCARAVSCAVSQGCFPAPTVHPHMVHSSFVSGVLSVLCCLLQGVVQHLR